MKNYNFTFTSNWFDGNVPYISGPLFDTYESGTPVNILEIGTHEGCSALWFLQNLGSHPDSRITTIDANVKSLWYENYSKLDEEDQKKIKFISGYSMDVLPSISDTFDIIYIDGSHLPDDIMTDCVLSMLKLKIGGFIILDDFHIHKVEGLDYLSESQREKYKLLYSKFRMRDELGSVSPLYPALNNPNFPVITPHEVMQFFYMTYSGVLEAVDTNTHLCAMYRKIGKSSMQTLGVDP